MFLRAPHLSSLDAMRDTRDDNDGQFISYATKQAQQSDRPNDGLLAVAQFALRAGIWASASQLIEQITDSYVRHNEYYLAKADIAKGLEDEALGKTPCSRQPMHRVLVTGIAFNVMIAASAINLIACNAVCQAKWLGNNQQR